MLMHDDTIFALSSGLLPSGVAIIRISGRHSRFVLETIIGHIPKPRYAQFTNFSDPISNEVIDTGLVFWFPAPHSFTGEDIIEIHCHGGRAVVARMLDLLSTYDGCRLAEKGEFTKRAFLNNKIDLLGVEGLSDLIVAETDLQRKQAQRQMDGTLRTVYDRWRQELITARALIEAELDFPDEEDVPGSVSDRVWDSVEKFIDTVESALHEGKKSERIREGVTIVLAGEPNAGKSSLLNVLAGRDVAIVTGDAGTTRDILDIYLNLNEVPVRLFDTAGIRETTDTAESIGVERARELVNRADIVVWLEDCTLPLPSFSTVNGGDYQHLLDSHAVSIRVGNKIDRITAVEIQSIRDRYDYMISTKTTDGLEDLIDEITVRATDLVTGMESSIVSQVRHRDTLTSVLKYLKQSLMADKPLELRADDLRIAGDELGRITGVVDIEDLLDVVFSEFCIGK